MPELVDIDVTIEMHYSDGRTHPKGFDGFLRFTTTSIPFESGTAIGAEFIQNVDVHTSEPVWWETAGGSAVEAWILARGTRTVLSKVPQEGPVYFPTPGSFGMNTVVSGG